MKSFFRSNSFKVMLIVILVLSCIFILSSTTGSKTLNNFLDGILSPMAQVGVTVLGDDDISAMSKSELEEKYEALLEENKLLREQVVEYYQLEQEFSQYIDVLELTEKYIDWELEAATVISRNTSDPYLSFTIDKGIVDGISVNDAVITDLGLVGIVTEVFTYSSNVTTILSEDINIGAKSEEYQEYGVVQTYEETVVDGTLKLSYLTKETDIVKNTVITTTGSGGIFPEGLLIGKVTSLSEEEKDVSWYAVIETYVDIAGVNEVFIITDFPEKEWQSITTSEDITVDEDLTEDELESSEDLESSENVTDTADEDEGGEEQ